MDLQTYWMIKGAGDDKDILTGQKKEDGKWYSSLWVNHPTPSGCDRPMLALSANVGFDTKEKSIQDFEENFDKVMEATEKAIEEKFGPNFLR